MIDQPVTLARLGAGRVGVTTADLYVDDHLTKIEASLQAITHVELTLEQMDRLERCLMKAHARNQIRVDAHLNGTGVPK